MTFHRHPTTFVNRVDLKVANLERSLEFYQNILGLKVLREEAFKAQLSADGETVLITIEQLENALPLNPRNTGLFHVAFLLPNRSDLATILQHLIQTNSSLQGASDHLVSEALYLSDPDGNGIEIYIDRDADEWTWKNKEVQMTTLALNAEDLMKEVDQNGWSGMPKETLIGHIHLQVDDLKKVEHFYTIGFGMDVVSRYGNQALFLSTGGYHHHIGLNTWNSAGGVVPHENSVGMKNYSLSMPSKTREKVIGRLKEHGYVVNQKDDKYYAQDPAGNMVFF